MPGKLAAKVPRKIKRASTFADKWVIPLSRAPRRVTLRVYAMVTVESISGAGDTAALFKLGVKNYPLFLGEMTKAQAYKIDYEHIARMARERDREQWHLASVDALVVGRAPKVRKKLARELGDFRRG
jgi:hypothetical protein